MADPKHHRDYIDEALVTIGEIHANIHRGVMFVTGASDAALANNGSLEVLIQVADNDIHVAFSGAAGGDFQVELFEGTTFSAAGTAATPVNRNRESGLVSTATFTTAPTITADGTTLVSGFRPGGSGGNAAGSSTQGFAEWELAPNTNYLARITNVSGGAQLASMEIDFYEPGLLG